MKIIKVILYEFEELPLSVQKEIKANNKFMEFSLAGLPMISYEDERELQEIMQNTEKIYKDRFYYLKDGTVVDINQLIQEDEK